MVVESFSAKSKSITEDIFIPATPHELYEMYLDSKKHSALTEASAKINRKIGGNISVLDGNFNGRVLELEEDHKIVQTWRSEEDEWPIGYYSKISMTFLLEKNGTLIHFEQTGVPEKSFANIKYGWKVYYWDPLRKYFEK